MRKVDIIFKNFFEEWLKLFPLEASFIGIDKISEIEKIPVSISKEFKEKEKNFYLKYKKIFENIKTEELDEKRKIYVEVLCFYIDNSLKEISFPEELFPINHFHSFHLIFPSISSGLYQSFKKKKEILNFYKKINYFKEWADAVILNLKEGIRLKVLLPFPVVEKIIKQIEELLEIKENKNPLFKPILLIERDYKGKENFNLKKEIEKKVISSYEKIYKFLKEKYIFQCKEEIGFHFLPDGDEWYKTKIKKYTTLNLEPEEIYLNGQEELKELKEVLKNLNLKDDKLKNPIKFLKEFKKEIKKRLKEFFEDFPRRDFNILPVEKYKEKTSSIAEYFLGGINKKSKPILFINKYLAKEKSKDEILAIFFHEAIPGHHYQISLQMENKDLPSFLKYNLFFSFVEGWALYSENFPIEFNLIEDESYRYAVIKNKIWRTLRLILDTGIHTGKLEKEKAIKILNEEGKFSQKEAEIEILRYAVMPGQALSYKIGENFFLNLKEKAKNVLKENFNVKEFHRILLNDGSLPLKILEKKVENWINKKINQCQ